MNLAKNTLLLGNKMYKLENNHLYISRDNEWLKVKEDCYFLRDLTSTEKILGLEGKAFSVSNGKFKEIELELFHEDQNLSYYISAQYGDKDNEYLVIMINASNGSIHLLGRTFEEVADGLWKIGNMLYRRCASGTVEYLQKCQNYQYIADRAEIWSGEADCSDLTIYKFQMREWEKIKEFPFMSRALR